MTVGQFDVTLTLPMFIQLAMLFFCFPKMIFYLQRNTLEFQFVRLIQEVAFFYPSIY